MLHTIHDAIQSIYRVDSLDEVTPFVRARSSVGAMEESSIEFLDTDEQLIIREIDGIMELGLFFADHVLEELQTSDLPARINSRNFSLFCLAAEGVSHLHYAAWCASEHRQVRPIELELQAEVDKYVIALLCVSSKPKKDSSPLMEQLFEKFTLHETLTSNLVHRYETANRMARRFCRHLHSQFVIHDRREALLGELRKFYRMGADKMGYADRA